MGPRKQIDKGALEILCNYHWPGNVRELKNLTERLAIMIAGETIGAADIPAPYNPGLTEIAADVDTPFFTVDSFKEAKRQFERTYIQKKLTEHNNNVSKTAKVIGVERSYLHKKIKQMKLNTNP
jgi:two-component system nitrogen regulation response regulator NtrX